MEVCVRHVDGVQFAIEARQHTVLSDQPASNGGGDTGMTPPELLLASVGSCAAFYAAQYLRTRGLPQTGLAVSVTAEKLSGPARMGNFGVEVRCGTVLTEEQTLAMNRSVHQCLIHNTLLTPPAIEIRIVSGVEASAAAAAV